MKNWKILISMILIASLWWIAWYIHRTRTYRFEEMSDFLAMCGAFIQTGFSDTKPGTWDYFLVLISALVVIYALVNSVKCMINPNEQNDHIKFKILEDE